MTMVEFLEEEEGGPEESERDGRGTARSRGRRTNRVLALVCPTEVSWNTIAHNTYAVVLAESGEGLVLANECPRLGTDTRGGRRIVQHGRHQRNALGSQAALGVTRFSRVTPLVSLPVSDYASLGIFIRVNIILYR